MTFGNLLIIVDMQMVCAQNQQKRYGINKAVELQSYKSNGLQGFSCCKYEAHKIFWSILITWK